MEQIRLAMQKIRDEADCLHNQEQVNAAIKAVAGEITATLADTCPLILTVMNGGMAFSTQLAQELAFPVEFDYIHVTRYGMSTEGGTLHWKVTPQENLMDRTVLIVDDILDEGYTLDALMRACQAQCAKTVYSAVLVDKQHDRKVRKDMRADFTALTVEDRFVFGMGMDYKGYWRNLPGIYAVRGE